MTKITSITYVKNGAAYIERCVRSVANQSLREIEIIVVDGGSTDGTLTVLERLYREDPRIKILTSEGSVGAQFNMALKMATGEYIAVCEGDDYIFPDKYEAQYKIAKRYDLDVLRACYYRFFECGGKEYRYKVETGPSKERYDQLIETEGGDQFLALGINGFWNGIYRREFLVSHNIYMNETKGAAYQDISFSFLCQLYAKRVWFMSDAYHCYRIDNPEASSNDSKCIDMHIEEYELLRKRLIKNDLWERCQRMFLLWELGSYQYFINECSGADRLKEVRKICQALLVQHSRDNSKKDRLPEGTMDLLQALFYDKNRFCALMLAQAKQNDRTIRYFENQGVNEKTMILFGAGHFGDIIYDFLKLSHKEIIVVDNSLKLQSEGYKNQKVHHPDSIGSFNKDYPIIIASTVCAGEMYKQLKVLGVEDRRIVICDNEELFLRKIFVRLNCRYGC